MAPSLSLDEARARLAAIRVRIEKTRRLESWRKSVIPVFQPLLQPSRYKALWGGRGGAKSHFFAELLLTTAANRQIRAVCVREVQKSLDQSVKQLLEDKIVHLGLEDKFRVRNSWIEGPHDGLFIFQGMQDHTAESIKSLEGFDIAWVEEAQSLSERSLSLLRPTIRKEDSEIWFSWNPQLKTDPVDAFFRDGEPPPSSIVVETSYKDNPYLPEVLKAEIAWDLKRSQDKYRHVWLGGYKKASAAQIFKKWAVLEFEAPRDTVFYYGADWGFATDPSVLTRCFFDGRRMFIDYEAHEVGCEIDDTPALFDSLVCGCQGPERKTCHRPEHGIARKSVVKADSARPETISYMQRHGYARMEKAKKGEGSVEEGVIFLQNYDIYVHPRCAHTIDELTFYSYKVDPLTGQVLPIIADKKNHLIDSLRYATEEARLANNSGSLGW